MKLRIESTEVVAVIDGTPCRLWRGTTENGEPCDVFVHRISVPILADSSEFDRELKHFQPPQTIEFGQLPL